jgi:class 3 adenylate cyclase
LCLKTRLNRSAVVEFRKVSQQFDSHPELQAPQLTDDGVQQMLLLAERLRESSGGVLDDAAILAVSEATGAPPEYVRLAVKLRHPEKEALGDRVRNSFLTLEPDTRRYVAAAGTATGLGVVEGLSRWFQVADRWNQPVGSAALQLVQVIAILLITGAIYNLAVSKDSKIAAFAGALFGGLSCTVFVIVCTILQVPNTASYWLVPLAGLGALGGLFMHKIVDAYRGRLGLNDPVRERQELLKQLVDIQDRLRSGEQAISFLSCDIVGSTRMKQMSDSLSVEFTFTEYHKFVEMIARRYGGRVHSTAGDGITLAFDSPSQAFGAARTIQTGIIELNTFRNKIGVPIVLRCGIHTGKVMAPDASDVTTINFAEVIDISAHLQKACPPGGIVVSDTTAAALPGGPAAVGSEKVITDSMAGYVWLPKSAARPAGAGGPPPMPASPIDRSPSPS